MAYDFCTLLDFGYLPQGLVLYRSLKETGEDCRLRVFCMDDETETVLSELELPNLETVPLGELEAYDPALAAVKGSRTSVEYCWTAKPVVCLYALERYQELELTTFLDADLAFFQSPRFLFDDLGAASTLLTPHRYDDRWQGWETRGGIYNSGLVSFRPTADGLSAARWWRARCLEWCYNRREKNRFGDQHYLDDWPERFDGVHILAHRGGGVAPWNVKAHRLGQSNGRPTVDGDPVVFFHHQSFRMYSPFLARGSAPAFLSTARGHVEHPIPFAWTVGRVYDVSSREKELFWAPYAGKLSEAIADIRAVRPGYSACFTPLSKTRRAYEWTRVRLMTARAGWRSSRRSARRSG